MEDTDGDTLMVSYDTVRQLADQLTSAEKARLIRHLSAELDDNPEIKAFQEMDWHEFIERTAGILSDEPIERPQQPPLEERAVE
jgi:hypothetical protein